MATTKKKSESNCSAEEPPQITAVTQQAVRQLAVYAKQSSSGFSYLTGRISRIKTVAFVEPSVVKSSVLK